MTDRCERELSDIRALPAETTPAWLAAMGEADWRIEREMEYSEFLQRKRIVSQPAGIQPGEPNPMLFPFQRDIVRWALRRGRAAIFADCGLGKGPMQMEWLHQVCGHTGKPGLILAPLAVSQQMIREARKFGYAARVVADASEIAEGINITNYEKLARFPDPSAFGGISLDESGILKGFDGKFRKTVTDYVRAIPFRLANSATPAPNDHMELGNHAEFLDVMNLPEMLATFFVHDGGDTSKWRLKGHAESAFWRWMASWAVSIRKPSDLGYEDDGFVLPALRMHQHTVRSEATGGYLFPVEAATLQDRNTARRDSIAERVAECAALVNNSREPWAVWCNLNEESALLTAAIPDAVEVRGSDSDKHKEQTAIDFAEGRVRVVISKPRIFGWGMNWQHCSHMAFVGLSDSYEALYQSIRRSWRFGQTREVHCHVITAETEGAVVRNIERKERQAMEMVAGMVEHMKDICRENITGTARQMDGYEAALAMRLPAWIGETA